MASSEVENSIFKPLFNKLDLLKTNLDFLKCVESEKQESLVIIKQIENLKSLMVINTGKLKSLLKDQHKICEDMEVEQIEIMNLMYKLDVLNNNNFVIECDVDSYSNDSITLQGEECALFEQYSPVQHRAIPEIKPKSIAFDMMYITEEEFNKLPKYMVGRLSLQGINKFIDVVNEALSKKYNLLSKDKWSLKNRDLNLYRKYKYQNHAELKGKHFITEEDLAKEYNKSMLDKKSYNFLTILRHSKRLLRSVFDGNTVYVVTSPD